MPLLAEDGWLVAAHRGRFDVAPLPLPSARIIAIRRKPSQRRGELLAQTNLDDRVRIELLGQV
jgi:hypothetical protein